MSQKDILLELGTKHQPVLPHLKKELTNGGQPVLIDKRNWRKRQLEDSPQLLTSPFGLADAESLPFENDSVSLVVEKDMFCSDGFPADSPRGTVMEHVGNVDSIASEIVRVTKKGGKVIAVETLTPTLDRMRILKSTLVKAGLNLKEEKQNERIMELFETEPEAYMTPKTNHAAAFIFEKE